MKDIIIDEMKITKIGEATVLIWDTMVKFNQISDNFKHDEKFKKKFIKDLINEYLDNKIIFICAYYNEKVIGIIGYQNHLIKYLFVDKKYQNKGIGCKLMNYVLLKMKQNNVSNVYLNSTKYAHKFYKKMQFLDNDDGLRDGYEYPMIYKIKGDQNEI